MAEFPEIADWQCDVEPLAGGEPRLRARLADEAKPPRSYLWAPVAALAAILVVLVTQTTVPQRRLPGPVTAAAGHDDDKILVSSADGVTIYWVASQPIAPTAGVE